MQFLLILAVTLMMVLAATTRNTQQAIEVREEAVSARQQIDRYRTFMFVANLYMQTYSGGAATLTWNTLRTAPGAPSGAVQSGMPATWKIVVAADNSWVACTELDERALGSVQQLAVAGGQGLVPATVGGQSFVVVGGVADQGKAGLCG